MLVTSARTEKCSHLFSRNQMVFSKVMLNSSFGNYFKDFLKWNQLKISLQQKS